MPDITDPVRLRGRALQRARAALFARHKWCVPCEAKGLEIQATMRSHLVPLAEGGTEDPENTQGLCLDCWTAKKDAEALRGLHNPGVSRTFTKASAPRNARGQFSERRVRPDAWLAGRDPRKQK